MKNTPKEHPDYQALVVAVDKVKSVVAYIDEGRKASEELHKLIEIQNSVEGCHVNFILFTSLSIIQNY